MSSPQLAVCRSCAAQIYWVVTEHGKKMPVDAKPVENGNIIFVNKQAHVLRAGEQVEQGVHRWISHYATCPQASSHRKAK